MDISFRCQGGARAPFVAVPSNQSTYDIIVFVIGSNDLGDGKGIVILYNELIGYANQYVEGAYCIRVLIMTLLPRSDNDYMERMRQFNRMLTSNSNDRVIGWHWSKKMARYMQLKDAVHLTDFGYRKAAMYLASPIFYFCKPTFKKNRYFHATYY